MGHRSFRQLVYPAGTHDHAGYLKMSMLEEMGGIGLLLRSGQGWWSFVGARIWMHRRLVPRRRVQRVYRFKASADARYSRTGLLCVTTNGVHGLLDRSGKHGHSEYRQST